VAGAGLKVDLKERQTSHDALVRNIKQVGPLMTTRNQSYHAVLLRMVLLGSGWLIPVKLIGNTVPEMIDHRKDVRYDYSSAIAYVLNCGHVIAWICVL
jgi:hypothetical protein